MAEKICRWRKKPKTGAHVFHYEGKRIRVRPGEMVDCPESCFSERTRGDYELVTILGGGSVEEDTKQDVPQFVISSRGNGFYDVVSTANPDKPLNSKALRKGKAEAFLEQLSQEPPAQSKQQEEEEDIYSMEMEELEAVMNELGLEFPEDYTEDDLRREILAAQEKENDED